MKRIEVDRFKELPEELWESILDRLVLDDNYWDFELPSLVCKQFLSITNRLRRKFVADDHVLGSGITWCDALSRALERFRNLKEIALYPKQTLPDVESSILKIAYSGLDLQSISFSCFPISPSADSFRRLGCTMTNLKVIRCTRFVLLRDPDLVYIADALPQLEELDIRYPKYKFKPSEVWYPKLSNHMVTDAGIETISLKLRGLRRINISGIKGCSDHSLIALSSNCVNLNKIRCRRSGITIRGIYWVLCHSTTLTSLHADFYVSSTNSSITFNDWKISAIGLRELTIRGAMVHVECLVRSLANAGVLLEKLKLFGGGSCGLSVTEVTTVLCACPSLKHFTLKGGVRNHRINDNQMSEICQRLPNIVSIELSYFIGLTAAIFFVFAKECPALSKITMRFGSLGPIQDDFVMNLERNYRVRYLDLSDSSDLGVILLEDIVEVCPNLHTLKLPVEQINRGYAGILSEKIETGQIKIEYG
ncbi:hypothetical protein Vadar_002379 [Vaccinium darrowii]|uniref:Uncharacterized protein n=1 Tax=Vaccinium darrowii TaxID=229202 RepID=A0ACB7ZHX8_9ERIC|nr:hypothetical protein Vadar_002379 [Vaccinium darrowii]